MGLRDTQISMSEIKNDSVQIIDEQMEQQGVCVNRESTMSMEHGQTNNYQEFPRQYSADQSCNSEIDQSAAYGQMRHFTP